MKRFIIFTLLITPLFLLSIYGRAIYATLKEYRSLTVQPKQIIVPTSAITNTPTFPEPTPKTQKQTVQVPKSSDEGEWGTAREIEKGTYTIKVGNDDAMGTPIDVFNALNAYRATNGQSTLSWDDTLARYAQSRAEYMDSIKTTDKHAGFNHYLENDDGFNRLGFYKVGENSYYGGPLTGTHLIEWVFSKSPGHDANQKSPDWTHVGVGVSNSAVNLNFGGSKM